MPDSIEDQIKLVEKLRNDAKLTEALDLIEKIERNPTLKDENRLLCLNLKGELFYFDSRGSVLDPIGISH